MRKSCSKEVMRKRWRKRGDEEMKRLEDGEEMEKRGGG